MANADWLPRNRSAQLTMAGTWFQIFSENEGYWKIPEEILTTLNGKVLIATNEMAIPAAERNAISNARLKSAFADLTLVMRDLKRRFIFSPPLTDADIISIGLRPKDREPTPISEPTGQAEGTITFPGRAQLMLRLNHVAGTLRDIRAYYGYRIHFGLYNTTDIQPQNGSNLRESRFTRRKTALFNFSPADSGKTAYFSVRYENSKGDAGPWGPMFSALIP